MLDAPRYQNRGAVANSLGEILDETNEEEILKILLEHKKTEKSYLVVSIIENVIKEYEAVDDGMSAYGKLQKDLKATQAAQEVTDQAVQELILATMEAEV